MSEHHGSGKDEGGRVGLVGTHDVLDISNVLWRDTVMAHLSDVSASRLEESVFLIFSWIRDECARGSSPDQSCIREQHLVHRPVRIQCYHRCYRTTMNQLEHDTFAFSN